MDSLDAFEKFVIGEPGYHNLSQVEKIAFTLGFMDGFEAAAEERDELLVSCERVLHLIKNHQAYDKDAQSILEQAIAKAKGGVSNE